MTASPTPVEPTPPLPSKRMELAARHSATQPAAKPQLAAEVIEGKSTKFCPHCKKVRKRKHGRSGPLTRTECENMQKKSDLRIYGQVIPFRDPRVQWLRWFLRPRKKSPYFFCWEKVVCENPECVIKKVGSAFVLQNCYYRQFDDARLILHWTHDFFVPDAVLLKNLLFSKQ